MSSALEARLCQVLGSKRAECQHEDQEAEKAQELSARTFRKVTRAPFGGTARLMTSPSLKILGFVFYLPRDGWRIMVPPTDFIRASKSAMFF